MSWENMEKTKLGLDENIEAVLCYAFFWVTGIIFYVVEDQNKFVRFHAMQSILVFLPLWIFAWAFGGFFGFGFLWGKGWNFLWWIGSVIWIITFILWLILMLKAYLGEKFKVPILGDIAEKHA